MLVKIGDGFYNPTTVFSVIPKVARDDLGLPARVHVTHHCGPTVINCDSIDHARETAFKLWEEIDRAAMDGPDTGSAIKNLRHRVEILEAAIDSLTDRVDRHLLPSSHG